MSHETIYQSLLVQRSGAQHYELCGCLPTLGSQEESGLDLANWSLWSGR